LSAAGATVLVIGIGNELRGDDGAGLEAVRRLTGGEGVELAFHRGHALELLELWRGAQAVVLVDAVCSAAPPGTIHRFEGGVEPLDASVRAADTHAVGVRDAVELARALGRLPSRLVIYGIEGAQFEHGIRFSEPVAAAMGRLVGAVDGETRQMRERLCA
jgi:hydrogenase maturation protease